MSCSVHVAVLTQHKSWAICPSSLCLIISSSSTMENVSPYREPDLWSLEYASSTWANTYVCATGCSWKRSPTARILTSPKVASSPLWICSNMFDDSSSLIDSCMLESFVLKAVSLSCVRDWLENLEAVRSNAEYTIILCILKAAMPVDACQSIVKSPEKCHGSSLPHQNHRGRLKKVWWVEWSSWKWQHSFTYLLWKLTTCFCLQFNPLFCAQYSSGGRCSLLVSVVYTIDVEGSLLLLEDLGIGIQVAKSSELRCANLCAL